ncbi:hypothetical protein G6F68_018681 [Rhizopus microsporus]|nr:hypothetical protein G6F68_018681 [Rhizopus microsporus]
MQQAEHRARQGGRQHAPVQRRAQVDDEPAREGPGGHDAFNAQRRGQAQYGNPEGRGTDQIHPFHVVLLKPGCGAGGTAQIASRPAWQATRWRR